MNEKDFKFCKLKSSIVLSYLSETVTAHKGSLLYKRIERAIKDKDFDELRSIVGISRINKIKQKLKF